MSLKFLCQGDGARWNIPVEILHTINSIQGHPEIHVVRAPSFVDLRGIPTSGGWQCLLVPECELYDNKQH